MMHGASGIRVPVRKGRRVTLLLARERSGGLLFHEGIQYRAKAIRAKARAGMPVRQGR